MKRGLPLVIRSSTEAVNKTDQVLELSERLCTLYN